MAKYKIIWEDPNSGKQGEEREHGSLKTIARLRADAKYNKTGVIYHQKKLNQYPF